MRILKQLNQIIKQSGAQVGLAAQHVATGEEILIEPDISFHPASTMKICVMMEAFRQARQGLFSLDDPLRIKNDFASLADGSAYSLSVADDSETGLYEHIGEATSIRGLVFRMISVSSNLATNLLIERVTAAKTTDFMRVLGTDDVIVRRGVEDRKAYDLGLNNAASARGLMQILLKLAKREVVSPQDSDEMLGIMLQQKFNEMIPAGLPAGVRVAHKTGWNNDLYHDAGIVYPPDAEPFVLVILTRGCGSEEQAHALIASLANVIYEE
jgi:beta-lactamase class A